MSGTRRGTGETNRVTQREAAEALGVSVEAIRKRIKRGTLPSEKGEDGRRYVYLDDTPDEAGPKPEDQGPSDPLIEAKDETIEILREQLRAEREAHAEARRIIAALTSRIPEIEAPRGSPPSPEESPERSTPGERRAGPEAGGERLQGEAPRPWWRRVFGG